MKVYTQHGFSIFHADVVESTMDAVQEELQRDIEKLPCVVLADRQIKGRGRRANVWSSLDGNFFATIAVPFDKPLESTVQLSFLVPLVVGDALRHFVPDLDLSYKWPNDILFNGKKIAGILIEVDQVGKTSYLKIGVGINLLKAPDIATNYEAVSLFDVTNITIINTIFLAEMLKIFNTYRQLWDLEGFTSIRDLWLKYAAFLNQRIQVNLPNETLSGIFQGIDEVGALCLLRDGKVQKIMTGDVYALEGNKP